MFTLPFAWERLEPAMRAIKRRRVKERRHCCSVSSARRTSTLHLRTIGRNSKTAIARFGFGASRCEVGDRNVAAPRRAEACSRARLIRCAFRLLVRTGLVFEAAFGTLCFAAGNEDLLALRGNLRLRHGRNVAAERG